MWNFSILSSIFLLVVCSGGCAQTGAPQPDGGIYDPPSVTKTIELGCTTTADDPQYPEAEPLIAAYELTVDPGPIVAGANFGASLEGKATISEVSLGNGQALIPYKRVAVLELQATVHVRRGTAGSDDVILEFSPIATTCTYDENGNTGPHAGPDFPPCLPENDQPDGSNSDCTGRGGGPDPVNRCLPFASIPTSNDCTEGGECDQRGHLAGQCEEDESCQCDNGFCVTGPFEWPLEAPLQSVGYQADDEGVLLFGWDDQPVDYDGELRPDIQQGGDNDQTYILRQAVFDERIGPNGIRALVGGTFPVAFECTMGVTSRDPQWGVDSLDALWSERPDELLISFEIQ